MDNASNETMSNSTTTMTLDVGCLCHHVNVSVDVPAEAPNEDGDMPVDNVSDEESDLNFTNWNVHNTTWNVTIPNHYRPFYSPSCCLVLPVKYDDDNLAGLDGWVWLLIGCGGMCVICCVIIVVLVMRTNAPPKQRPDADDGPGDKRDVEFGSGMPGVYKVGDRVEVKVSEEAPWSPGLVTEVAEGVPLVLPDGWTESQKFDSTRHVEQPMQVITAQPACSIDSLRLPKSLPGEAPKMMGEEDDAVENDYLIASSQRVVIQSGGNKMAVASLRSVPGRVVGPPKGGASLASYSPSVAPLSPLTQASPIVPSSGQGPFRVAQALPLSYAEHRSEPAPDTAAFSKEVAGMV
eukprot:TRINITY_DN27818_c0_g1_i1.p1 TRINITY_DN27818_c0_g1~~TRINITY_DN27818_c0_g1_i1.p1  ORF type:complete len:392 (+),score=120.47 TRINITY_DN27818_c0_g1_i1:130-1176(+)